MAALAPAKTAQRQGAPAQARPIWTEAGAQKVRDSLASEAWEARLAAARAKREKVLAEKARSKQTAHTDWAAEPLPRLVTKACKKQARTGRRHLPWLAIASFVAGATTAAATILLQIPRTVPDNLASAAPIVILEPAHSTLIAPTVTSLKTLVIPDGAMPALAGRPDAPTFVYFPQEPIQIDTRPAPPHAPLRDVQITVVQGNGTKYDKRIETLVAAGASVERRAMGLLPSRSVVRYFYRGDMKKAETVASLLSLDVQHLDNYSPKPEPAVIEVILGN